MRYIRIKRIVSGIIFLFAVGILFVSCGTCNLVITDNMLPAEYFQKAEIASQKNCYDVAISYYQKFLEKYPNNIEKGIWAEYEIAMLYHKKGENEKALGMFKDILARYDSDTSGTLPPAPKTLTQRVITNIEKSMKK
jgi:tetratricopeptide (TPR) repeat protein